MLYNNREIIQQSIYQLLFIHTDDTEFAGYTCMTNRERWLNCALGRPIDRSPFSFYFGPWGETLDAWRNQGVEHPETAWFGGFGFDPPVIMTSGAVNMMYCPGFVPEILEVKENTVVELNTFGQIVERRRYGDTIPHVVRAPVTCLDDWKSIRDEKLDPDNPARFACDYSEQITAWKHTDAPVQVGAYPGGLFGTLRDLMGVEECLYAFYDNPMLVHEIMTDLTDFWLALYEKICRDIQVDIFHIWEDMSGKQGSMISCSMVREFMLPQYRRIRDFCRTHDIPVIQVDTDGNCEELIPVFHEAGVNMMMPFEVTEGSSGDIVGLRGKYPYMAMQGGIDKRALTEGPAYIDRELSRIYPLIGQTGYFPALDHLIPPDVSFENYRYFVNRLKEMIFA